VKLLDYASALEIKNADICLCG